MREKFISKDFGPERTILLGHINNILAAYERQGYQLTLRQLYYQLVARDLLPSTYTDPATGSTNNIRSYKKIGDLVSDGRQAGVIDWSSIEDRGRTTRLPGFWSSPAQIVRAAANSYRTNKWTDQPWYVHVMVEKDALAGILEPVCADLEVSFTANKGYTSSSAAYWTAKRIESRIQDGKQVLVLYLGDHDPSGMDMTRDVTERLGQYAWAQDSQIEVRRLALNIDQVHTWNPPENPAKETDSRSEGYIEEFGHACWELDAVEPRDLVSLVRDNVLSVRDEDAWQAALEAERKQRQGIIDWADMYDAAEKVAKDEEEDEDGDA